MNVKTVRYLTSIPRQAPPTGQVIVHNHVIPQATIGLNGFRVWIAAADSKGEYEVELCPCEWASRLDKHYRVKSTRVRSKRAARGESPAFLKDKGKSKGRGK